jgi:hypothetical protein
VLRDEAEHMRPRQMTVALPYRAMCYEGVKLLLDGERTVEPVLLECPLVERGSVAPAACASVAGGATANEGMGNVAPNGSLPPNLPRGGQRQTPLRERRTQMSKYISNSCGCGRKRIGSISFLRL